MKKKYKDHENFRRLEVVFKESDFLALKDAIIDEYGLLNICQVTLKTKDIDDQELYTLLDNFKISSISFLSNIGNQIFAQNGHEEAKNLPYPHLNSAMFELPREEIFNTALTNIKKIKNSIRSNLNGFIRYPDMLDKSNRHLGVTSAEHTKIHSPLKDGEVSVPANIWITEASKTLKTINDLFGYFAPVTEENSKSL